MKAFQSIKLGKIQLHSNVVQGPLAGYSCAPFRVLTHQYGNPGFCATEMISAKDLIHRKDKPKRYLYKDPQEGLLCYQLSGEDPSHLAQATQIVTQSGADLIDLNCGCPVHKIRAKSCGSKLLTTPEKLFTLITAIKQNTDAVVSIKVRVSHPVGDHNDFAVIDSAQKAGVDFITVHGRHWTQRYDVPCQNDQIAKLVEYANVPVFANGDVEDLESLQKIFNETGCAGVMIARASVGRPWLFEQLKQESLREHFVEPNHAIKGEILLEHIQKLKELENEKLAVLQARKLAKYYARTIPNRADFVTQAQQVERYQDLEKVIKQYFTCL